MGLEAYCKTERETGLLREYDFTIITKGDQQEADFAKTIEGYENLMKKSGGDILKKDDWGTKRLAYPIKKSFRGHYLNYDFVGDPINLAEMERLMRIDDNVLRYMAVRLDESNTTGVIDAEARRVELAKADAEEKEASDKRREQRN